MSYNALVGIAGHLPDSRLHVHLNGDGNDDGTGDLIDRLGNIPGFSTGDVTFGTPRFGTGKAFIYNTAPANTTASESSLLGASYVADFTLAMHAKPAALGQTSQMLWEAGGNTRGHAVAIDEAGNAASYISDGGTVYKSAAGPMNSMDWQFVAMTFKHATGTHRVTQDATSYDTGVTPNKTATGGNNGCMFGVNSNAAGPILGDFVGQLQDITYWRGALTQPEEQELHLGPEPRKTTAPTLYDDGTVLSGTYDSQANGPVTITTTLCKASDGSVIATATTTNPDFSGDITGGQTYYIVEAAENNGGNDPDNDQASAAVTMAGGGGTPVSIDAAAGAASITGAAATLTVGNSIAAGAGAVDIIGHAATLTVGASVTIAAGVGSAAITGHAPTIAAGQQINAAAGAVTVTGHSPAIAAGYSIAAGAGAVDIIGHAATLTVGASVTIAAGVGSAAITGHAPAIAAGQQINAAAGAADIIGHAATLTIGGAVSITAGAGAASITGQAPAIAAGQSVEVGPAVVTIAAANAAISAGAVITAAAGAVDIIGHEPIIVAAPHLTHDTRLRIDELRPDDLSPSL